MAPDERWIATRDSPAPQPRQSRMAMESIVVGVFALVFLLSLATTRAVEAQVPTAADFAACNREAPQLAKAGTTSPIEGDYARAGGQRAGAVTTKSTGSAGKAIESSDPQIHGMEAEGARDAAYQAAYRGCMRRRGF